MKRLLALWDPENPLVPVGPVLRALAKEVSLKELTFRDVSHRTKPNGTFSLRESIKDTEPDAVLWIEGGPYPSDIADLPCPKASWILSGEIEPSLVADTTRSFHVRFSGSLSQSAEKGARWLPLSAGEGVPSARPLSVSMAPDDPLTPARMDVRSVLRERPFRNARPPVPIVLAWSHGTEVSIDVFEGLRTGAAVVCGPETDLRGVAHVGEHAERAPSNAELSSFLGDLLLDSNRLSRLSAGGPTIVSHLHTPDLRARQLAEGIWPRTRVLGRSDREPRVSILVGCYRFLRRFKLCLESLARQSMPPGSLEIVVADPESPDGLEGFLAEAASRWPHLRIVHLPLDGRYRRNRGLMINRAFDASSGEVVISIDGDIVFPSHLIGLLTESVERDRSKVFGARRIFLNKALTEDILAGRLSPFTAFEKLALADGDGEEKTFVGVLGYCQAVTRAAFAAARYPEELDMVNQSDIVFVERLCRHASVRPVFLEDQPVLHLWHPRNWSGTEEDL